MILDVLAAAAVLDEVAMLQDIDPVAAGAELELVP